MLTTSATLLNVAIMAPERTRRSRFAASPRAANQLRTMNVRGRMGG